MTLRAGVLRSPRVRRPEGRLEPGPGGQMAFVTSAVPPAPALFRWTLSVEGHHAPDRIRVWTVPLREGRTATTTAWPRGRYHLTARWQLGDAFGFTRFAVTLPGEAVLVIEPEARPGPFPRRAPTRPGTLRTLRRGERAGDPFDVRPYVPGDDLRRLHWPLLAHADQPFVRTADPSPPPRGRPFVILDLEAASDDDLDPRLALLRGWLDEWTRQGEVWTLVVPGSGLSAQAGHEVGPLLAALSPQALPAVPPVQDWPAELTLLSAAGSAGAARWLPLLAQGRRRVERIDAPAAVPPAQAARPWWSRR